MRPQVTALALFAVAVAGCKQEAGKPDRAPPQAANSSAAVEVPSATPDTAPGRDPRGAKDKAVQQKAGVRPGRGLITTSPPAKLAASNVPFVAGSARAPSAMGLAAVPGSPAKAGDAGSAAGACDLRKVDWSNFNYPGIVNLRKGTGSDGAGGSTDDCSLDGVDYGDLDANGLTEAYAVIRCSPGGTASSDHATVAVLEMRPPCALHDLGTIVAGWQATGKVAGRSYVVERPYAKGSEPSCCPTGQQRETFRLSGGKWTSSVVVVK